MKARKTFTLNYLKSLISCRLQLLKSLGMPSSFIIEPTNLCDQKCPVCETGLGILKRKKGLMSFESFKIIADKIIPYAQNVALYWMGEPMLNRDIYEMIKYLKKNAPRVAVSIASDGNKIDVERLVKSGLDSINFKLNGLDAETHNIYRVGGDFDLVKETIKEIMRKKKELNVNTPHVAVALIVMKHNEAQMDQWQQMVRDELGPDQISFLCASVRTVEQASAFLPENREYWMYDETELAKGKLTSKSRPGKEICEFPWNNLYVTWDGDVSPCCFFLDNQYTLGNLLKSDLSRIWNGEEMQKFRKMMCTIEKEQFVQCAAQCAGSQMFPSFTLNTILRHLGFFIKPKGFSRTRNISATSSLKSGSKNPPR
jgi:radical SAM protein with 4Fe4S-binding SPASM domain